MLDSCAGSARRDPQAVIEKVFYTASRTNIAEVWVDGRSIAGAKA